MSNSLVNDRWLATLTEAVKETDYPLGAFTDEGLPQIALPIDLWADKLLEKYVNEPPQWNALEVESLVETLSNRIAICISLRDTAQDLEAQALDAFLAYQRNSGMLQLEKILAELRRDWEPRLSQNQVDGGRDETYWKELWKLESQRINLARETLRRRLEKSTSPGNGSHLVERFENLKKIFEARLRESYRLARAVSAGLGAVYGLTEEVPTLTTVGYLNQLAVWTGDIVEKVDRLLSHRSETVVVLAIGSYSNNASPILPEARFKAGMEAGILPFRLTEAVLTKFVDDPSAMANPRLRALRSFFLKTGMPIKSDRPNDEYHDAWKIRIDLPPQLVAGSPVRRIIQTSMQNLKATPSGDLSWSSAVHNLSPLGDWELRFGRESLLRGFSWNPENTMALGLELRLAFDLK